MNRLPPSHALNTTSGFAQLTPEQVCLADKTPQGVDAAPTGSAVGRRTVSLHAPASFNLSKPLSHSSHRACIATAQVSTASVHLAEVGNKAIDGVRNLLRLGPTNQVFALASHGGEQAALAKLYRMLEFAFVGASQAGAFAGHSADYKFVELFVRWQNQRLHECSAQISIEDRIKAFQFSPSLLPPITSSCDAQPTLIRLAAFLGTGSASEFANMTACLAAHEMAMKGIDGHAAVFFIQPDRQQEKFGHAMGHAVAGIYDKAERCNGVDAPLAGNFMVLDTWQEQACAMPAECTRYRNRLPRLPAISFEVRGGVLLGARSIGSDLHGEVPGYHFPDRQALKAISLGQVNLDEVDRFLRDPGATVSLEGLNLTYDDRVMLARHADELHQPFVAGFRLPRTNGLTQIRQASELAAQLKADPEFALNNQIFGSVSALHNDAPSLVRSPSGSVHYPLRGNERPYPGLQPSSLEARAMLEPTTVMTTDALPGMEVMPCVDTRRQGLYDILRKEPGTLPAADLQRAISDLDAAVKTLEQEWRGRFSRSIVGSEARREVSDPIFLPALAHAENVLTPGLNLVVADSIGDFCNQLQSALADPQTKQLRFIANIGMREEGEPLDKLGHAAALDVVVHHESPKGSKTTAICLDSTDSERLQVDFARWTKTVQERLPQTSFNVWQYSGLGLQKGASGCHVYALSTTKKMQDHVKDLGRTHHEAATGSRSGYVVPYGFYKHAGSKTVLKDLEARQPGSLQQVVNKKDSASLGRGQTLEERARGGDRLRLLPNLLPDEPTAKDAWFLSYNASIEAKRIQFFKRACFVYQQEARQRDVAIDPCVVQYDQAPSSSVGSVYDAFRAKPQQ